MGRTRQCTYPPKPRIICTFQFHKSVIWPVFEWAAGDLKVTLDPVLSCLQIVYCVFISLTSSEHPTAELGCMHWLRQSNILQCKFLRTNSSLWIVFINYSSKLRCNIWKTACICVIRGDFAPVHLTYHMPFSASRLSQQRGPTTHRYLWAGLRPYHSLTHVTSLFVSVKRDSDDFIFPHSFLNIGTRESLRSLRIQPLTWFLASP